MLLFLAILKWSLVVLCIAAGIDLLASGLGGQITSIEYKGLKANGIASGIIVMLVGVAIARFWHIQKIVTRVKDKAGKVITRSQWSFWQ